MHTQAILLHMPSISVYIWYVPFSHYTHSNLLCALHNDSEVLQVFHRHHGRTRYTCAHIFYSKNNSSASSIEKMQSLRANINIYIYIYTYRINILSRKAVRCNCSRFTVADRWRASMLHYSMALFHFFGVNNAWITIERPLYSARIIIDISGWSIGDGESTFERIFWSEYTQFSTARS